LLIFSFVSFTLKNRNYLKSADNDDGAIPRDGGAEEFRGDTTVGPHPKVEPEVKNGKSSAKDGAPEKLRCSNAEAGELDPANGVRGLGKKNSVLSCKPA